MSNDIIAFAHSDTTTTETMTSVEIADVVGKRHDNVVRDLRDLEKQGVIGLLKFGELKEIKDLDGHSKGVTIQYPLLQARCTVAMLGVSA